MKKKIIFIFSILLTAIILVSCTATKKSPPYSIKQGAYDMEKAIITNIRTNEVTEKSFDDIINAETDEYLEWRWLFNFSVGVNKDTEFIYKSDNRCFILNEGLAYELIEKDTLKLHFPRWQGNNNGIYDIIIIFGHQILY